ncbi:hypothetical protein PM082_015226 [Marasmius tenuissimus]|nr:hypothetical protein PM082_015226 [Marasmius tenuissimus]
MIGQSEDWAEVGTIRERERLSLQMVLRNFNPMHPAGHSGAKFEQLQPEGRIPTVNRARTHQSFTPIHSISPPAASSRGRAFNGLVEVRPHRRLA